MLYGFERRRRGVFRHGGRALALAFALPLIGASTAQSPQPRAARPGGEPLVEGRALWVTRFEYNSPADVAEIVAAAASANFNVIYFQVRGQGDAYYRSDLEPCAVRICGKLGNGSPPWDPLAVAIREAHARGLELHAYMNALPGWASPRANISRFCSLLAESRPGSPRHMLLANPDWVMTRRDGTPMDCYTSQDPEYAYVSPGIPAVRVHTARVAADVARRYPVDGIHLDRIRYPGPAWSYDEPSVEAFQARTGRMPARGADPEWDQFRREQLDALVKAIFDSITAARQDVALSAAVWPIHDREKFGWPSSSAVAQFYQDARAWASGGYIDVVAPMTYHRINGRYCSYNLPGRRTNPDWACLLDDHQAALGPTGAQLYMGLWADYGAEELVKQIQLGREKRVHGFALFSYESAKKAGLFDALRQAVFAEKARVPSITRLGPPSEHGSDDQNPLKRDNRDELSIARRRETHTVVLRLTITGPTAILNVGRAGGRAAVNDLPRARNSRSNVDRTTRPSRHGRALVQLRFRTITGRSAACTASAPSDCW